MLLTFLQHQRQQISRQSLVPLLSDASPVGPSAMAFTSPLASPLAPPHNPSLNGLRSVNPPDSRTGPSNFN
ncbi:hypothetical protein DSO57_1036820 [Entomophthora muscae]|nr:hypothetical protein DSO57_1036820 [Entomophthora muscae]